MINFKWKWTGSFPKEFASVVKEEFTKAMLESVKGLETEVAQGTPVGVGLGGHLRTAIRGEVLTHLRGVVAVTGASAKYGDIIEIGRRPGPISKEGVASIMLWVRRKLRPDVLAVERLTRRATKRITTKGKRGGNPRERAIKSVTFLVARKIREKGFKGKFMFQKAEKKMARRIAQRFEQAKETVERLMSDK